MNWHNELLQAKSYLKWAQEKLGFTEEVTIFFNGRLTSRGGDANWRSKTIRLSPEVWEHGTDATRRQTVLHEFAHIFAGIKYGSRGHDWRWKNVMHSLGIEPKRCHNTITPRIAERRATRAASRVTVYCPCQSHKVTKRMHDKISRGHSYKCMRCQGRISIVDIKNLPRLQTVIALAGN